MVLRTGYAIMFSDSTRLRVRVQGNDHVVFSEDWRNVHEVQVQADSLIDWLCREYPSMDLDASNIQVQVVNIPVTITTMEVELRVVYGAFQAPNGNILLSGPCGLDFQVRV